jgi:ABC-2 type transport system permease protein
MKGFFVLFRKELREQIKTHRFLIVLAVFLVLGMGTPLMLYYLPSIVNSSGGTEIPIPDFNAADACSEFLGGIAQIGMVVVILIAMGAVARERERGTAVLTLSKPIGRGTFIAAKMAALTVTFELSLIASALFCYLYTDILFEGVGAAPFAAATALVGLFLLVCISITLLCSSVFKSAVAAGGTALAIIVALWALSAIPNIDLYAPMGILNWGTNLVLGDGVSAWGALCISLGLAVAFGVGAWQVLVRKEI